MSNCEIAGIPAGTTIPVQYARIVGQFLYVWGWPLVNMHNRVEMSRQIPESGLVGGIVPAAPTNHITMLTDYVDPAERIVATPNQDVVYGLSLCRLDESPVVVQVPDFGDRFWVYQVADQRTDGFAQLGKMYGTKAGYYLLAHEDWQGEVPKGIDKVFRTPTACAAVIPRLFVDDAPEDKLAIQPLVSQILVYPLDEFTGEMQFKDWSKIPNFPAPPDTGGETKWVLPDSFFETLKVVLDEVPPMPGEEAIYAQARALVTEMQHNPEIADTLKKAANEVEDSFFADTLFQWRNQGIALESGWTMQVNAAEWGHDYLTRASAARANMFSNAPKETIYFALDLDSQAQRLNSERDYRLTFAKGQLPPVSGFWSLTMYNTQHFFEPNAIARYSIGTKNRDLRYDEDGSLTIYLSRNRPDDPQKAANWLPAPAGEYSIYIRAYWPGEPILNRQWTPPAVADG